jgi:hypothetical protein
VAQVSATPLDVLSVVLPVVDSPVDRNHVDAGMTAFGRPLSEAFLSLLLAEESTDLTEGDVEHEGQRKVDLP